MLAGEAAAKRRRALDWSAVGCPRGAERSRCRLNRAHSSSSNSNSKGGHAEGGAGLDAFDGKGMKTNSGPEYHEARARLSLPGLVSKTEKLRGRRIHENISKPGIKPMSHSASSSECEVWCQSSLWLSVCREMAKNPPFGFLAE
eukprot:scaffold77852_cov27-Prasinocladus_malaysianus.AAC.1